ncbi:MerR family transcriptional regulator [Porphyrobacter sp. SLTP]|uniref:MerR family transcriptional regulator n=1 Tax=Porphyrobacter sp. SLTP TaxID=2683266 RepID=UPI001413333E|nr:MerR family transcriptional regulator [Porphyrobacter sp. SLTP]NBB26308.1 MerR family transcriptional regulator [Porphyrobacter sp. SLTP]
MTAFDDGKDDSALRTIGEVSEALGIKPHVLRYWEAQFPLLKPLKRSGGRRYYRPTDVALVETINRLVNREGYTLKGAEAVLRSASKSDLDRRRDDRRSGDRRVDGDPDGALGVRLMVTESPDMAETIAALKSIRARLAAALEA